MKSIIKVLSVLALVTSTAVIAAPDLVSTVTPAKGGALVQMDLVNDGSVYGLQFDLTLPKLEGKKEISTKSCLSGLTSAFASSTCTIMPSGNLRVVVFSMSKNVLETGPIGEIFIPNYNFEKNGKAVKVTKVVMGDIKGQPIKAGFVQ